MAKIPVIYSNTKIYEENKARNRTKFRADSRFVPSQWEMPLQSNAVFHWLGANLESALELKVDLGV